MYNRTKYIQKHNILYCVWRSTEDTMKDVFRNISAEKLAKIRKYFFLAIAIIATFLTAITLIIPYFEYELIQDEPQKLIPMVGLSLLQDAEALRDGVAYIGMGVFIGVISMIGVILLFLGKGVLSFFYNEQKLAANTKIIAVLSTVLTGVYFLSSVILCAILRAGTGVVYLTNNSWPFILMLIVDVIYSIAAAFLNKENVETKEQEEIEEGSKKKTWIRRGIFLGLSALSLIILLCLYGTAFMQYGWYESYNTVSPNIILYFLRREESFPNNVLYSSLVAFVLITIAVTVALMMLAKCIVKFFSDEQGLVKLTKKAIVFASIFTGFYFIGSIILCSVFYLTGARVFSSSASFIPFFIMLIIDVVYATMLGIHHKRYLDKQVEREENSEKKKKHGQNKRIMYKARFELFICSVIIVVLSVVALLSNIMTVTFDPIGSLTLDPIKLSGYELVTNYLTIDQGGQILAFIIIALLSLISAAFIFTVISFLSRSNTFYKLTLVAVAVCTIATFLVGMFGKYYQVVQTLNESMLSGYILDQLGGVNIFEELGVEWGYKVTSASLYYSLGSLAVIAYLLIRNPYTKGIAMEKEFALLQESKTPQTIKGEVSLTDVPDAVITRNDGTVVATDKETGEEKIMFADPCSIFTELDKKIPQFAADLEEKRKALFENPTLPKLIQFIVEYARDSRLHLSYTEEDIATFVAGLGTTKLSILQGMSGTGKTSLPKIFAEALHARCEIVEVESSWRDKNELLGYYNEFSKNYTPKKFTQALYRAKLNPETLTFIVLDEMNLSRIEYYFSDFLSLMENEPDKRELRLLNVSIARTENGEKVPYSGLSEGHTLKIPGNVWFIGTANRDESTFEISDKVYDRAHTMNFNKRAAKVLYYNDPIPQRFLPVDVLEELFAQAKRTVNFNIDNYPVIGEVEKLLSPYNISFGNRIAMQMESFVNVYCSCFATSESVVHSAVERILLSKVVSKLELKSVDNKEMLAAEFEKLNLRKCSEFILKLNED